MKKTNDHLEYLVQLASQQSRVYSSATMGLENAVIRTWRCLPQQDVSFVKNLSIAFMGAFSIALTCFLLWLSTVFTVSNDEVAFENSINYLCSSQP